MTEPIRMNHGVQIREHKHWNTKTVYNEGHVVRIYRRQPKTIRFQSPMVNDFNQHLCDGWHLSDIEDVNDATIQQLVTGRKPFACVTYPDHEETTARDAMRRLEAAGLVAEMRERGVEISGDRHVWDVLVCHDLRVRDIGDLRALGEDYAEALDLDVEPGILLFADRALSSFFDDWDTPPLPLWLTGLILGYPVENTVSIYLESTGTIPVIRGPRS
jgi:hypothetical protein